MQSETGAIRFNEGKAPMQYLPLDQLQGLCKVLQSGEFKYGRSNWRHGFDPFVSLGSVIRHLSEIRLAIEVEDKSNEQNHLYDKESGMPHIDHLLASLIILRNDMVLKGYKI
jgi:hypothetical protein